MTFGCVKGYCGPYKISRLYWKDAGLVTLSDDDVERAGGKKISLIENGNVIVLDCNVNKANI